MSSSLVHELKNYLQAMSGAAYLGLLSEDPLEWRSALKTVQDQCRDAVETMRAFLGFTKRRDEAEQKTFTASAVLAQVRRLVHKMALRNDVEVRLEVEEDAEVRGEMRLATQVILNLVTNAIQAIGDGRGSVELRAERPTPEICRFVVSDDGPGIPESMRKRLFRPFATERRDGEGHGLGLFIVKQTVRRLEGAIRVRTGPGGTTFTIDLPAVRTG